MALYRGSNFIVEGKNSNPFIGKPRQPTETSVCVHNWADQWFFDKFKIKARSTTLMCSPSIEFCRQFSNRVFEISPIECGSIIYSENVNDFSDVSHELKIIGESENNLREILELRNYRKIDLIEDIFINFNGEVMLYCHNYNAQIQNS